MENNSSLKKNKLVIDVMGSDMGPNEIIHGVSLAFNHQQEKFPRTILVGNEVKIKSIIKKNNIFFDNKISIVHASEVIEMDDHPIYGLKAKKDSSMVKALDLIKNNEAKVLLSCGNTGSLMAGGKIKLKTISGIERPALASIVPSCNKKYFILLDAGANPEPTAEQMVHNAIMGFHYYKAIFKIDQPRVGLLTTGTEEGKGMKLTRNTHEFLKKIKKLINYSGLIEGFQLFQDAVDVVVCDGFVGNVLLKSWESMIYAAQKILQKELNKNFIRKIASFLSRGAYYSLKNQFDPNRYGAVPLLGLTGTVLKAHGSSNRLTIKNAIESASVLLYDDLEGVKKDILFANNVIRN